VQKGEAERLARDMNRRSFFLSAFAISAWTLLSGHSPYRKFQIYRKTRLIVMAPSDDERAGVVADGLAAFFATYWKDSKSTSGRARTAPELVRLVLTNQLEVAVLSQTDAASARTGQDRFAKQGPAALCALAVLKDHVLVTREDLLKPIVTKIIQAMQSNWKSLKPDLTGAAAGPYVGQRIDIPLHRVAADFYRHATQALDRTG
jgi:hypothetical protein